MTTAIPIAITTHTADTIKTRMSEMPSSTTSLLSTGCTTGCTVYTITPFGRLDLSVVSLELAMAAAMFWVFKDVSTFAICDVVAPGDNCIEKTTMILDSCKRRLELPYTVIEETVTAEASTPASVASTCIIESAMVRNTSLEMGNISSTLTTGASTGLVGAVGVVE